MRESWTGIGPLPLTAYTRGYTPPHLPEIAPVEIDAWDTFLFALRLSDAWHEPSFMHTQGTLDFSWGFRRQSGRLLERLDRFYIGAWASMFTGSMMIWPGTALSDHAPLYLRIVAQRPAAPCRGCRIPDVVLSSDSLLEDIWYVSHEDPPTDFALFIAASLAASSETCRHHATARRRFLRSSEQGLHIRLASIHRLQQQHSQDSFLAHEESEARAELSFVLERRAEFTYHASVSQWIGKADRMNKYFFATFRERPSGSYLRAVRHSDGALYSQPDEVLGLAADYFESLFVPDVLTIEIADARDEVWSHVPVVVTLDMSVSLMRPFTDIELRAAVASLDASSCPGDDGLTLCVLSQTLSFSYQCSDHWRFSQPPFYLGTLSPSGLPSGSVPFFVLCRGSLRFLMLSVYTHSWLTFTYRCGAAN